MKTTLTSIMLVLSLLTLQAQENSQGVVNTNEGSSTFLPDAEDLGVTLNLSGLINNIMLTPRTDLLSQSAITFRYVSSNKWTYRVGISPMITRRNFLTTDSVGKDLVQFDSTYRQANIGIRPGVEYHFEGTSRLDPYIAADVEFGIVGGTRIGSVTTITDTTGTSRVMRTITQDGGFTFGAKLSAGMNYFVAKKWSFGLEYGVGVYQLVSGGDRQEVVQIEPVSGSNTTIRNLSSARQSNTNLLVDPMVRITISYFFKT